MEILPTQLEGTVLLKPSVFTDERGYFFESFQEKRLRELIPNMPTWVQDNESKSAKGVLRGLHFQNPPSAQAKLVRVVKGKVQDVAVDLRKGSPTYGQWESVVLSAENKHLFYVPAGFAHGFLVLEEGSIFAYKCSSYYDASAEDSLLWNDPDLAIDWLLDTPILSEKDAEAPRFADFDSPFSF